MRSIRVRLVTILVGVALLQGCTEATSGEDKLVSDAIYMAAEEGTGDTSTLEPEQAAVDGSDQVGELSGDNDTANVDYTESAGDEDALSYPVRRYRESFDENDARDEAESDVSSESYRSIGRPYGCTDDCSGHEAGFKYRARKGYGSRIEGDYEARSFRQGQQAYDEEVDRRVEEAREEYDDSADQEE